MNKKVVIWSLGIIAVGALGYTIYVNQKRKRETEILKKSIDELAEKYKVFNQ